MLQAFVIVLREGFEGFLIVAIILAYLRKTERLPLIPAVYWGIGASILTSGALGCLLLKGANQSFWEGVSGVAAAVLVTWLVLHMWHTAPQLKRNMEHHLTKATVGRPTRAAFLGILLFTILMISREGTETALLLIQVHEPKIVTGILLGLLAAATMAILWTRLGHLINLKLFFQVTSIFLLLFVAQILVYSFHEFTEAGVFPHSEKLHAATEVFSPQGKYGKWFSLITVGVSALWLCGAKLREWMRRPNSALPPIKGKGNIPI